jgi:hypothetical protein
LNACFQCLPRCPNDTGLHALVRELIATSPQRASRSLDWFGQPTSFTAVPTAAEFCRCCAVTTVASRHMHGVICSCSCNNDSMAGCSSCACDDHEQQQTGAGEQPPLDSLLAAALALLVDACEHSGRRGAAMLYSADISDTLEQLCCFTGSAGVIHNTERLYSFLMTACPQLRDEVMQDGRIIALTGALRPAAATAAAATAAAATAAAATAAAVPAVAAAGGEIQGMMGATITTADDAMGTPTSHASLVSNQKQIKSRVKSDQFKLMLAALGRLTGALEGAPAHAVLHFCGATTLLTTPAAQHNQPAAAQPAAAQSCSIRRSTTCGTRQPQ